MVGLSDRNTRPVSTFIRLHVSYRNRCVHAQPSRPRAVWHVPIRCSAHAELLVACAMTIIGGCDRLSVRSNDAAS